MNLDLFIKEAVYRDETFVEFDSMSYAQIEALKKELMGKAQIELNRRSQPRLTLEIDSVDFLKDINYTVEAEKLVLGDLVWVKYKDENKYELRILEYTHDYDSNKLTLKFANKFNFNDSTYELNQILKDSTTSTTTLSFNKKKYSKYVDSGMDEEIGNFIYTDIDTGKNAIGTGENQDVRIDQHGIWLRKWNESLQKYEPEQMRIINNMLVITDNNWTNVKTTLNGKGLVADTIRGRLLLGQELRVETESGKFTVDNNGDVTLNNMTLNLIRDDGLSEIHMDTTNGLTMWSNVGDGNGLTQNVYIGSDGKVKIKHLDAVSGTFTGDLEACTLTGILRTRREGLRIELRTGENEQDNDLVFYDRQNNIASKIDFSTDGTGNEYESTYRFFFRTYQNYALKFETNDANMSFTTPIDKYVYMATGRLILANDLEVRGDTTIKNSSIIYGNPVLKLQSLSNMSLTTPNSNYIYMSTNKVIITNDLEVNGDCIIHGNLTVTGTINGQII
jgi:hypothetical protein